VFAFGTAWKIGGFLRRTARSPVVAAKERVVVEARDLDPLRQPNSSHPLSVSANNIMTNIMKAFRPTALLALVLLGVTDLPAAGVGAELPVGFVTIRNAPGLKLDVVAASPAPGEYLMVWRDGRGNSESLLATRVKNGEVFDPLGIIIERNRLVQAPQVLWTGTSYVVVWKTFRNDESHRLFAARLSRFGEILTPPHEIADQAWAPEAKQYAAIIGDRIVVAYLGEPQQRFTAIRAVILDSESNVVDDLLVASGFFSRIGPAVAASTSSFAIVWSTDSSLPRVEGVRLNATGTLLDKQPRVIIAPGDHPVIASDGTGFVLAFSRPAGDVIHQQWYVAKLNSQLIHDGMLVRITQTIDIPQLIRSGSRYLLVAREERTDRIFADDPFDAEGPWTLTPLPNLAAHPHPFALVSGSELLLTWIAAENANREYVLRSRTFDANVIFPSSPERDLSFSANQHASPAVAFDGTNYLVAWRENSGIYATRVTPGGESLDGRGVQLATFDKVPVVAFDGTHFLVAYASNVEAAVTVRYIGTDGRLAEEVHVMGTRSPSEPVLVPARNATLVVWTDGSQVAAARLDHRTHSASSPVMLSDPTQLAGTPRAAWNGTEVLVAWDEIVSPPFYSSSPPFYVHARVLGARISDSLVLRDLTPLVLADGEGTDSLTLLGTNGSEWLLTWNTHRGANARAIRPDATIRLEAFLGPQDPWLDVEWDGTRYGIATTMPPFLSSSHPPAMLWLDEQLRLSPPSRISDGSAAVQSVALTRGANGLVAAYLRNIAGQPYGGVDRTFLREVRMIRKRRAS
jgi:hypothetical protein